MEVILISAGIGTLAVLIYALKRRSDINERGGCPECGMPAPIVRAPTSWRQAMWGGWTCAECGTEMDRSGRKLART